MARRAWALFCRYGVASIGALGLALACLNPQNDDLPSSVGTAADGPLPVVPAEGNNAPNAAPSDEESPAFSGAPPSPPSPRPAAIDETPERAAAPAEPELDAGTDAEPPLP